MLKQLLMVTVALLSTTSYADSMGFAQLELCSHYGGAGTVQDFVKFLDQKGKVSLYELKSEESLGVKVATEKGDIIFEIGKIKSGAIVKGLESGGAYVKLTPATEPSISLMVAPFCKAINPQLAEKKQRELNEKVAAEAAAREAEEKSARKQQALAEEEARTEHEIDRFQQAMTWVIQDDGNGDYGITVDSFRSKQESLGLPVTLEAPSDDMLIVRTTMKSGKKVAMIFGKSKYKNGVGASLGDLKIDDKTSPLYVGYKYLKEIAGEIKTGSLGKKVGH